MSSLCLSPPMVLSNRQLLSEPSDTARQREELSGCSETRAWLESEMLTLQVAVNVDD